MLVSCEFRVEALNVGARVVAFEGLAALPEIATATNMTFRVKQIIFAYETGEPLIFGR